MSSTLLDRVSAVTAFDRDRWRPASIAPGWGTTDLNIPLLDISVASLAGLAKTLWGPTDLRVTGEVVPAPRRKEAPIPCGYGSRIPPGLDRADTPGPEHVEPGHRPGREAVRPRGPQLLLHTDPLSLANHDYITEVEQYRARSAERPLRPDLCELHQRGEIVEAIGRCISGCGTTDKALAYILWGDLLQKASDLRGQ